MRTTVSLDDDVVAAVEELRSRRGLGLSAAVNELVRHGLVGQGDRSTFVQSTSSGHARVDVTNVADVLDMLDEPAPG